MQRLHEQALQLCDLLNKHQSAFFAQAAHPHAQSSHHRKQSIGIENSLVAGLGCAMPGSDQPIFESTDVPDAMVTTTF